MITKEQCLPNTIVVVNDKITQWNKTLGTKMNGLNCFPFSELGVFAMNEDYELPVNTVLVILSKPTEFNGNGNQVKFKIQNTDEILSSWWNCIKHKVNKVEK